MLIIHKASKDVTCTGYTRAKPIGRPYHIEYNKFIEIAQKTGSAKKELSERGLGIAKQNHPQSYPQILWINKMLFFNAEFSEKILDEEIESYTALAGLLSDS